MMMTTLTSGSTLGAQRFLLVSEVAVALQVSTMTVYRMIRDEEFAAVKMRTRLIVPTMALDELATGTIPFAPASEVLFLDVRVAAHVLRVSKATLYRMVHDCAFPAVSLRGRVVVPGRVIDEIVWQAISAKAVVDPKDWVDRSV